MLLIAAERMPACRGSAPLRVAAVARRFCGQLRMNVYCGDARNMLPLYTALHRNILDVFNEYGVQIMTPAYEGDPEQLVSKEQWYAGPGGAG